MTNKEKMLTGELYILDEELTMENYNGKNWCRDYNSSEIEDELGRERFIRKFFAKAGQNPYIEAPFRCDYGYNIEIGDDFYANYDCIFVDVCKISIGDDVMIGPRVCIYTATHPLDAKFRRQHLEYGKAVTIGNDVWIGGNTVINPGVRIGNNVVIGSGLVVVSDIPDNVIAVGNPCKVIRNLDQINEELR